VDMFQIGLMTTFLGFSSLDPGFFGYKN